MEIIGPSGRAGAKALHAWCTALAKVFAKGKLVRKVQEHKHEQDQQGRGEQHVDLDMSSSSIADDVASPPPPAAKEQQEEVPLEEDKGLDSSGEYKLSSASQDR